MTAEALVHDLTVTCPHCDQQQTVRHTTGYNSAYYACDGCSERFIVEPRADGVNTYKPGEAPDCCSDPDCRETNMAAGEND